MVKGVLLPAVAAWVLVSTPGASRAGTESPAPTPSHSFAKDLAWAGDSILHPKDPYQVVPGKDANGWSFTLEPYLWAMGMSGDIGIKGFPATQVDFTPKNILQHLDWAVMAKGEIRKGRWGVMGDGFYAALSANSTPPGPLYDSAEVKVQQGMASLALTYRIIDDRRGFLDIYAGARYNYFGINIETDVDNAGVQSLSNDISARIASGVTDRVDAFIASHAGALQQTIASAVSSDLSSRVLAREARFPGELRDFVKADALRHVLTKAGNPLRELVAAVAAQRLAAAKGIVSADLNNRVAQAQKKFAKALSRNISNALPTSLSGTQWWVDPIIGLRGQINFTRWLFLAAQGDVGGFGAGSEIAWNVQATLGVNFTRNVFGELGYRYFYMDYANGGCVYNAGEAGIFAGIGVKF